ncbi:MAG: hypothetical protein LJF04_03070 [Gemmatimonadetes bacterium]|nr:hypothetical protein [Gemmatimonadota bacterium]
MNMHLRRVACGAALILVTACGHPGEEAAKATASPSAATGVDLAVATARAIQATPAAADSILRAHGLTPAGFDSLMYDIATDPALARTYAEAMRDQGSP